MSYLLKLLDEDIKANCTKYFYEAGKHKMLSR